MSPLVGGMSIKLLIPSEFNILVPVSEKSGKPLIPIKKYQYI